jgi:hypothetical protein
MVHMESKLDNTALLARMMGRHFFLLFVLVLALHLTIIPVPAVIIVLPLLLSITSYCFLRAYPAIKHYL